MDQQTYLNEILRCYTEEIYGREMFYMLAKQTRDSEVSCKCTVLGDLEAATLAAMDGLIAKYDLSYNEKMFIEQGRNKGALYAERDWHELMQAFASVIDGDLLRMERLLDAAEEDDREALEFLVAHEAALRSFILAELENKAASLAEAEKLLSR